VVDGRLRGHSSEESDIKSINLTAPINGLGYGVVGLNALVGLDAIGCSPALWVLGQPEAFPEHRECLAKAIRRTGEYDRLAPSVRIWQQFELAQHVGKGCHAAVTYFERDLLYPNEVHHLQCQDVVIASSPWMNEVLVENGIPAERIRLAYPGIDRRIFRPAPPSPPGPTRFLAVGKWEVRKGHDVLVQAFHRAFRDDDKVELVLLTANPFLTPEEDREWRELYTKSPLGHKVRILGRLLSQRDVALVMTDADCGVFLSRAEGWNLDLAEMLAMGRHCIATNFSAHAAFANEANCRLVEINSLEPAYDGRWFFGHGNWAELGERQILEAAEHMRSIHELKQAGRLGTNEAGVASLKELTWENFARQIVEAVS
jgi:glycosyltransferase involved in cell wall biosynthesis